MLWLNWDLWGWVIFGDYSVTIGLDIYGWIKAKVDMKKQKKVRG